MGGGLSVAAVARDPVCERGDTSEDLSRFSGSGSVQFTVKRSLRFGGLSAWFPGCTLTVFGDRLLLRLGSSCTVVKLVGLSGGNGQDAIMS